MNTLTTDPNLGMFVAAAVAVAVVIGLFIYLWRLDRRVEELRRVVAAQPVATTQTEPVVRPQRRQPIEELSDGNARR